MAQESRVKKSLLNARVNLIFYFLTLVLSFFSRKIFLEKLGADFVGLTGTLQNLLGFLNLAELGIGSAIGYVLYKPIYDQDRAKINEVISVFGYLYRKIGFVILIAGCLLACFLPLIFSKTIFGLGIIYFAFFAFLISSLIGYFVNYRQTLLGADQRNYVVTAYFQTTNIVKVLVQIVLVYYTGNYYLWVAVELSFGIIYSFILNWRINQVYPWLKSEVKLGKELFRKYPEVMKYTKQLFVHKMAAFVKFQTTPLFIYTFVSLKMVAFYGNYTIFTSKLIDLIVNLLGGSEAGVGNLIAEGNKNKIVRIFWELLAIRFFIAGTLTFALYHLIEPFIILWIGSQYILGKSVLILLLCNLFIGITNKGTEQFLYGYGLFHDIWAPIVESIIYIIIALVGGHFWGLQGILLAGVISMLIIMAGWKPIFLYRCGFKLPIYLYWLNWLKYLSITIIAFGVSTYIVKWKISVDPSISYQYWIMYAAIIMTIFTLIYFVLMYSFTIGMRDFVFRVLKMKIKNNG